MTARRSQAAPAQSIAVAYAIVTCGLIAWAWYVDATLLHAEREHHGPDFVLMLASWPTSLLAQEMPPTWSRSLAGLGATVGLTLCAAFQAVALLSLARWWDRHAS